MGKGDKKTKRGKIVIGSSGVRHARKKKRSSLISPPKPLSQDVAKQADLELPVASAPKKSVKKAETGEVNDEKPKVPKKKKTSAEELPANELQQD